MNQPPPPPPPLPQVPLGPAGKARLYLPHRLFAGHQDSFQAGDSPVANAAQVALLPIFPLPPPAGLIVQNPAVQNPVTVFHMHPLQEAERTISSKSQTKTAKQIQHLQTTNDRLTRVLVCRSFWDNLMRYASHPNIQHGGPPPLLNTTWTIPLAQRIPLPLAEQQIDGVKALSAWYLYHVNRAPVVPKINNEPGVQGEVLIQAIEPMNGLLKTRYPPLGADEYPRWGRSCNALHRTPGLSSNAGYPDFLLIRSAATHDNGAVIEIKMWRACKNSEFTNMFMDNNTVLPDGSLVNNTRTIMGRLLKQIWGQLYYFECFLGFVTNGRLIVFFAKSGQNTLILSPFRDWDDPDVYTAFAGLSYAGVDIRHVGQAGMVDQLLCPQADRVPHW